MNARSNRALHKVGTYLLAALLAWYLASATLVCFGGAQ